MHQTGEALAVAPKALAESLERHQAVTEAWVERRGEDLVAWVVVDATGARVAASGECEVIRDSGASATGRLCDISMEGARLIVDDGDIPRVGDSVQVTIDSPAIGGLEGWLGQVRWQRGFEFGVGFRGNVEQGVGIARLISTFLQAGESEMVAEAPVGLRSRVIYDEVVDVQFGRGGAVEQMQAIDISAAGVGVRGSVQGEAIGREVFVTVHSDAESKQIKGVIVRQGQGVLGIALGPNVQEREWLQELVGELIRRHAVSADALREHCQREEGAGPDRFVIVDSLPRGADGEVDAARLQD